MNKNQTQYEIKLQLLNRVTLEPLQAFDALDVCLTLDVAQLARQQAEAVGQTAMAETRWEEALEMTALVLVEALCLFYGANVYWRPLGAAQWRAMQMPSNEVPR